MSVFQEIEEILSHYDMKRENQRLKNQVSYLKRSRQSTRAANQALQNKLKELKNGA